MTGSIYLNIFAAVAVIIVFVGCGDDNPVVNGKPKYVPLEYANFMKSPLDSIAARVAASIGDTLASGGVYVVGYTMYWDHDWVEGGYKYTTIDDAVLRVWIDSADQPVSVSYDLKSLAESDSCSMVPDTVESIFSSILNQLGMTLDGSENVSVSEQHGLGRCWYEVTGRQTFQGKSFAPYARMNAEGADGEIIHIYLPRWYTNLSSITNVLSFTEIGEKAMAYYAAREDLAALPDDSIISFGSYARKNALCELVGSAWLYSADSLGTILDLYIDLQSGEVVDERLTSFGKR